MKHTELYIPNWVRDKLVDPADDAWLEKFDPHTGQVLYRFADSSVVDAEVAVSAARETYLDWSKVTPIRRGQILAEIVARMKYHSAELAACVQIETGKPLKDAQAEVGAAILQGEYFAGEGMRLYAKSLTSGMPGKSSYSVRQPLGVAALIVPANTPIANIAWKAFPALICGNTVVLKASEDAPKTANLFAEICKEGGLPAGTLNVLQGIGSKVGAALVLDPRIDLISFTGSTEVGRWIAEVAGRRLARVSLELGGKNPFVVCDDADLDYAAHWAILSAFSNAGQRCAAGSRIIVFSNVYEEFKERMLARANSLRLGIDENCDLGPLINLDQQRNILGAIGRAERAGALILCGGKPPKSHDLSGGFYIEPTLIEDRSHTCELSYSELFGPVATLHEASDLNQALAIANDTPYGLTSAIHTNSVDRATWFTQQIRAGVVNVNIGTYGSEPHMPFGGFGLSGNGTREPGAEALDVYSELKNVSFFTRLSSF